jgi:hypothetical protein
MKYLERMLEQGGFRAPVAYYHPNWPRGKAPLLDLMGAEIDHVKAHSRSGSIDESNLVTACHRCNLDKSNSSVEDFRKRVPLPSPRGKYGEPEAWDGLSTLFIMLAGQDPRNANASERAWLRALKANASAATQI